MTLLDLVGVFVFAVCASLVGGLIASLVYRD